MATKRKTATDIVTLRMDSSTKKRLDDYVSRTGSRLKYATSSVLEWFLRQDPHTQAVIVGTLPGTVRTSIEPTE